MTSSATTTSTTTNDEVGFGWSTAEADDADHRKHWLRGGACHVCVVHQRATPQR